MTETPPTNTQENVNNKVKAWIYIICISILSTLVLNELNAQSLSFGPKLGYTNSTLNGNDVPNGANSLSGITGGFFFKANANEVVAIQPEILYAQRGATTTTDTDPDGLTLGVDYLQVPLLIKVQIPTAGAIYPFVYAGPYGAFELDNNFNATILNGGIGINSNADVHDFDYGGIVGAGMDFQLDNLFIGFDARYDIGMSQIVEIDNTDQDMKNRAFTIFASLGVNLD